jgi:acetylornithine deacetylase/succinyl-diaminopimelate desuccinylase-like protein
MKKGVYILLFCLFGGFLTQAQSQQEVIKQSIHDQQWNFVDDFKSFLSIPNVAANPQGILDNAQWLMAYMKSKGIEEVSLLALPNKGVPPVVFGEVKVPGATETIVFYAHYDGQPVDTTKWYPGLHPFKPTLYSGMYEKGAVVSPWLSKGNNYDLNARIYARGASDDKAGVMAIINAYAQLKALNLKPTVNIKFFFEGEEEAGSPNLEKILDLYKNKLAANMWVICDGPVHQSGKKQLVMGVRGDTHLELTVFGPKRPLHSGHYGNWVLNPAMELARLLASMKNDKGEVTIKGFYDDVVPLSALEKEALAKVPSVEAQLKNELGINATERSGALNDALQLPSLNINGLQSAGVGKFSANVIPTKAIASVDMRLVKGNDWLKQQQKVINHIKAQGFYVTDKEPTDEERKQNAKICMVIADKNSYNAQKTSLDNPYVKRITKAMESCSNESPVILPTLGGSLPLFVFEKILNTSPITVPIVNHDNNQHAENENIKLKNFFEGIQIFASIMLLGK